MMKMEKKENNYFDFDDIKNDFVENEKEQSVKLNGESFMENSDALNEADKIVDDPFIKGVAAAIDNDDNMDFVFDKAVKTSWWKSLKKSTRGWIIAGISVLLAAIIALSAFLILFRYNFNDITKNNEELGFEEVIDKKIINIALFGIDTRNPKSFSGRSDSIMILSLNTETKKIKVISIMRDSLVPIETKNGTTYNKINSAYNDGPEQAIKTINKCFGLDISEYATVNFFGMSEMIDAVGGIEAELTEDEAFCRHRTSGKYGINDHIYDICRRLKGCDANKYYIKKAGKQHLNGIQAVAYSRIRYMRNIWGTNDDYGRTDRQRYVMKQLFNKAVSLKKTQYPKFAKTLIPYTETSLSLKKIISIASSMLLHSPTFEETRIPQTEFTMRSPSGSFGSVVYYDLNYASKVIKAFIYDDMPVEKYVEKYGIDKNDWYAQRNGGSGSYSHYDGTVKPTDFNSKVSGQSSGGDKNNNSSANTSKPNSSSSTDKDNQNNTSSDITSSSESSDTSSGNESTDTGDTSSTQSDTSSTQSDTSSTQSDTSSTQSDAGNTSGTTGSSTSTEETVSGNS